MQAMKDFLYWNPIGQLLTVVFYLSVLLFMMYLCDNAPALFLAQ